MSSSSSEDLEISPSEEFRREYSRSAMREVRDVSSILPHGKDNEGVCKMLAQIYRLYRKHSRGFQNKVKNCGGGWFCGCKSYSIGIIDFVLVGKYSITKLRSLLNNIDEKLFLREEDGSSLKIPKCYAAMVIASRLFSLPFDFGCESVYESYRPVNLFVGKREMSIEEIVAYASASEILLARKFVTPTFREQTETVGYFALWTIDFLAKIKESFVKYPNGRISTLIEFARDNTLLFQTQTLFEMWARGFRMCGMSFKISEGVYSLIVHARFLLDATEFVEVLTFRFVGGK